MRTKKTAPKRIVYSPVVADLFHYGHLRSLEYARSLGDFHICGILTDKAVQSYRRKPIAELKERLAILQALKCVDEVMVQKTVDPTETLKQVHRRYPKATIIVVRGSDWKEIPERRYLESIGGKIVQHDYYKNLSEFKIITRLLESYKGQFRDFEDFTNFFRVENFNYHNQSRYNKAIISTKANTLKSLQSLVTCSRIEKTYVFTVKEWNDVKLRKEIIAAIQKTFSPKRIVVRSSAINEDTLNASMSGFFHSELDVDSSKINLIAKAAQKVVDSYTKGDYQNPQNQVLIQTQTENIVSSGVLFTYALKSNGPYYVINYDDSTGKTDTVTKGVEHKSISFSRGIPIDQIQSAYRKLILAVKEIEQIIPGIILDIEYGITSSGEVVIFQVRPLVANARIDPHEDEIALRAIETMKQKFFKLAKRRPNLSGGTTILADMPDWNPAEIIGDAPHYLDYSLYCSLITDSVWHLARTSQGYYDVGVAPLVVLLGNKPYIDARCSFNAMVPASLPARLREKLVNFFLKKLKDHPELQDKVEFEVLFTCYDFAFDRRSRELSKAGFSKKDIETIRKSLKDLSNNILQDHRRLIEDDLADTAILEEERILIKKKLQDQSLTASRRLHYANQLLHACRTKGTLQFSRLARLAFVGKILLKSAVSDRIIGEDIYHRFMQSVETVATEMSRDFSAMNAGKMTLKGFLDHYGHLRPGTYDITSLRYDDNPSLIIGKKGTAKQDSRQDKKNKRYAIPRKAILRMDKALKKEQLAIDAKGLFQFIKMALEAREYSKFLFTKSFSDAIEIVADVGDTLGISREELAHLDIESILHFGDPQGKGYGQKEISKRWKSIIDFRRKERSKYWKIMLPSVITSELDLDVVTHYAARPNFITSKKVTGDVVNLDESDKKKVPNVRGKIILLKNGDPGYDWIFTKQPLALITKYGGVASHMSIRCAEFGLPAAIGCGETIYESLIETKSLVLDCNSRRILPLT